MVYRNGIEPLSEGLQPTALTNYAIYTKEDNVNYIIHYLK